ncbi:hypothetical protein PGT21_009127 [Puccinia graminis f. sp. tritici]|uniref:Uncharacterized protein n=1 Tax=Puccinia graminis f. sp. tritici TaxID=56615 RepID=A0A5B0PNE3_PUCGR|nr:hypothetical protein PGT21_009127 [Puccinia graminis f. sp. tritici]
MGGWARLGSLESKPEGKESTIVMKVISSFYKLTIIDFATSLFREVDKMQRLHFQSTASAEMP